MEKCLQPWNDNARPSNSYLFLTKWVEVYKSGNIESYILQYVLWTELFDQFFFYTAMNEIDLIHDYSIYLWNTLKGLHQVVNKEHRVWKVPYRNSKLFSILKRGSIQSNRRAVTCWAALPSRPEFLVYYFWHSYGQISGSTFLWYIIRVLANFLGMV